MLGHFCCIRQRFEQWKVNSVPRRAGLDIVEVELPPQGLALVCVPYHQQLLHKFHGVAEVPVGLAEIGVLLQLLDGLSACPFVVPPKQSSHKVDGVGRHIGLLVFYQYDQPSRRLHVFKLKRLFLVVELVEYDSQHPVVGVRSFLSHAVD